MGRIDGRYTAVYALCTRLKTAAYTARVHGPCRRPCKGRLHVHTCTPVVYTIRQPCTRHVHGRKRPLQGRVHGPCTRPVYGRVCVHLYTCTGAVQTAVTRTGIYVYMARTRPLHGRVRAMYTAENGRCTAAYTGRVHGSYTARSRPCRRPSTLIYV